MLPKGFLVGRLTADPQGGVSHVTQNNYSRFSVACNDHAGPHEKSRSHFFNCIVWGKKAQFVQNYVKKGDKVFLEFTISTNNYVNHDGKNVKTFDLLVDSVETFSGSKSQGNSNNQYSEDDDDSGSSDGSDGINIEDIYV